MFEPSEFFQFLQSPTYLFISKKNTNIFATALKIFLLLLLFLGLINFLTINILSLFLKLPLDETFTIPLALRERLWLYFLLVGFISPIMEEIIFRLSLIFNPVNVSLSISTLIALITRKISSSFTAPIIIFFLLFLLIYKFTYKYKPNFHFFWNENFKYLFYFSAILFGFVHITNYEYTDINQYFIAPLLVFPQLAMGFIFSFTRMYYKDGFLISIICHILLNLISVSVFLHQYSHIL